MKIGVLTPELNKWQAGIAWGKAPDWQVQFSSASFGSSMRGASSSFFLPQKA